VQCYRVHRLLHLFFAFSSTTSYLMSISLSPHELLRAFKSLMEHNHDPLSRSSVIAIFGRRMPRSPPSLGLRMVLQEGRNHEDILPRPFWRLFGAAWRSKFTTYTLFWPTQEGLRCFIGAGGKNQAKVETRGSWRTALAEELHTLVPSRRQPRGWLVGLKHTAR